MIHPVVEHIKARRGKRVPVDDGRKIALFLFGGLMAGARGAGAVLALENLGLTNAFDRIYSLSAGFANACYFLSHEVKTGTTIYYEEMCQKNFLNPLRVWDVVDTDYILHTMKMAKPVHFERISRSPTELFARVANVHTDVSHFVKVNGRSPEEIGKIFKAATSVPFLNPGVCEIDGVPCKDAGFGKNYIESIDDILASDATDILTIYNLHEQYEHVKKAGIIDSDRLFHIVPYKEERLSHFCQNPEMLKTEIDKMSELVESYFV